MDRIGLRTLLGEHETFTGAGALDAHRRGGRCLRPPDAGLTVARTVWFGWSWPVIVDDGAEEPLEARTAPA